MPKAPRETTDPLGQKLLHVLRTMGKPDDLNELAMALGVTVQSTYDYINHGRVSKDRYPRLVSWSGRSLDWWFDIPSSAAPREPDAAMQRLALAAQRWLDDGVDWVALNETLEPRARAELAGFAKALVAMRKGDRPPPKPIGAPIAPQHEAELARLGEEAEAQHGKPKTHRRRAAER